jgi:hypothetical protein
VRIGGEIQAAESTAPNPFGFILSRRADRQMGATQRIRGLSHQSLATPSTYHNNYGARVARHSRRIQQQPCGPGAPAPFAHCETTVTSITEPTVHPFVARLVLGQRIWTVIRMDHPCMLGLRGPSYIPAERNAALCVWPHLEGRSTAPCDLSGLRRISPQE